MSNYEQVRAKTAPVDTAFYALLDRLDEYRKVLEQLVADEEGTGQPRKELVHRLRRFIAKADSMTAILEDDVLTHMLPLIDRLHTVRDAEEGTFI